MIDKKSNPNRKKLFLFLSTIIILFFLLIEFILRLSLPYHFIDNENTIFNKLTYKSKKPNITFKTYSSKFDNFKPVINEINSLGIRGKEISAKKNYRVLNIGDSYIEADEVSYNETFGSKLNNANLGIEFISHGITSWSPTPEFAWIYRNYERLLFDEVNLFLCVNDFYRTKYYKGGDEYYRSIANFNKDNIPVSFNIEQEHSDSFKKSIKIFLRKSYVLKTINIFKNFIIPRIKAFFKNPEQVFLEIENDVLELGQNPKIWDNELKENVLNTLNVLVDINSFLTKNNIKLNILIVPNIWYFKDEGLEFKKRSDQSNLILDNKTGIELFLKNFLEESKIEFIDLTDEFIEFKNTNSKLKLYYPWDGHWNANGHNLTYEILTNYYKNSSRFN